MSDYEQEVETLLAQYRKQRDEASETRRRINEVTATATAPRRVVKVTVSARGDVGDIEFPTAAFRSMTPKELGEVLKATIAEARSNALEQIDKMGFSGIPGGLSPSDLLTGRADISSLLPAEPYAPDAVQEYLNGGRSADDDSV